MRKRKGKRYQLSLLHSVVVVVLCAGLAYTCFSIFKTPETKTKQSNKISVLPRQYSDEHITPSAKGADPAFAHIGFAPVPKEYNRAQTASVIESISLLFSGGYRETRTVQEHGTWIWTPIPNMTHEYIDDIIKSAKKENINTLYVSIDSYLDIFALSKNPERKAEQQEKEKQFTATLSYLLRQARRNGIDVDAEAGWRDWAQTGHTYKAFAVVNYVKEFNKTQPYKFRGFQYDVEPYLLDEYKTDKETVLKEFLSLVEETRYALDENQLKFSVVIPEFFDGTEDMTPKFSYNGSRGYTIDHLLSILGEKQGTSIIIMAYRNFALGADGSVDISQREVDTADKRKYTTDIIIAQETGDVLPPYITFHNSTKEHLREEIEKINTAFENDPSFGGTAIHYVNAYLDLR